MLILKQNIMNYSPKFFYWLPRILCILTILFTSSFAFDVFTSDESFMVQFGEFILHLIVPIILLFILIVTWKKELLGGVIFMLLGIGFSPYVFKMNYNINHSFWKSLGIIMTITIPLFIVGVLFLVSYYKNKKKIE